MANFVGKWKQDDCEPENVHEFIKASGMPKDVAERGVYMRYDVEIKIDEEKWTMIVTTTKEPVQTFSVEFFLGQPYETRDMFGRPGKMVTTVENDSLVKDTSTEQDNTVINIIREVKGDRLINTYTLNGVSMKTFYTRE